MTIRARTIIVIVSTNFVIILLSILAGTGYVRENIENYIEADMAVVADMADRFISGELAAIRRDAEEAAGSLTLEESSAGSGEIRAGALAEQLEKYPRFIGMAVMSADTDAGAGSSAGTGNGVVAAAGELPARADALTNENILRAFAGETAFTSTVPLPDGGVAQYLAAPIPGDTSHILVLTLDGMYLSNLVSEYHVWDTGHIFIDDSEGTVIANIRPEWVQNRQNFLTLARDDPRQYGAIAAVIGKLVAGGSGIDYYTMDGISRICAYRPISGSAEGWALGIVAPLSESPVRDVDRGLLIIAAVSFLLNIAAAVIASNFIRKPFDEVAALREMAEAGSRAKSSFLAHMSHEIRTPLNAVVGLSELALDDVQLDGELTDKLEKIHASGMTILSIVNDILDISKIEAGKYDMYPARYDTPSLINDVVAQNIVRIGEKPVLFKLTVDENLPAALYGDDLRVKQVFNNLLSNALKYTASGTVEWSVAFERSGDDVWLVSSVRDTGTGIKPEDVRKLFSDYIQVNTKADRRIEGTGLGLAITRRLVEMMDGTITVDSEYGVGTVFHVRLRQNYVETAPIGRTVADNLMGLRYTFTRRAGHTKLTRLDLSYAHVLIVDDIATNLDVVKGMMKPYGVKIDCASSGRRAIELVRAETPRYSAIFMDHMMPGMDGIEATRIIRNEIGTDYARSIPIIALTANAIVGNAEMFLSRDFQDFISKPIDMAKLDAVLRRWVRDREREGAGAAALDGAGGNAAAIPGGGKRPAAPGETAINGVDMPRALARFSGDRAVLLDVLRSYAQSSGALLRDLSRYAGTHALGDYAIAVHGLKGASYGICADEAGKSAELLESDAKAGDIGAVDAGHPAFARLMEVLLADIGHYLCGVDAVSADGPSAAEPDQALLAELREACRTYDMDRVDGIIERLDALRYERGAGLVAWLRAQVGEMNFEGVANGEWPPV